MDSVFRKQLIQFKQIQEWKILRADQEERREDYTNL